MTTLELTDNGITIDGKKASEELNQFYMSSPVGAISTAVGDTFYGINHRLMPNPLPINKDHYGMTFFTRPLMNMTTGNLRMVRQMIPLLNTNSRSIPRIIRLLFDKNLKKLESLESPFVDNQQAFIPFLTDTLLSISGWPDIEAPMFNSPEGVYKESFSFVDGLTLNYTTYNIQASFRNVYGDPVTSFFLYWLHYMSFVYQGLMVPYPNMLIENEIDYQTRIYRLVLDANRNKVTKIAACGAAFPYALSIGASFNFEADRPLNPSNDQITVPFKCMGAMYQDDILIDEFNKTVEYFNWDMKDNSRKNLYTKIPTEYLILFNHRGYPRIDINTYELEWWIDKETYKTVIASVKYKPDNSGLTLDNTRNQ